MKTILIVGAGFSGTMTAIQLLQQAAPASLKILLVERTGNFGRGLAYGAAGTEHMLNVPEGNMSAFPDQPGHFLQFCQTLHPRDTPSSFVARRQYGKYLAQLLAQTAGSSNGALTLLNGEVASMTPAAESMTVTLADGQQFEVEQVVLAAGNAAPANPRLPSGASGSDFYASTRYVQNPWSASALAPLDSDLPVLLIGTGLTTIDLVWSLMQQGASRLIALSRHGLLPQPHRAHRVGHELRPLPPMLGPESGSLLQKFSRLHRHLRAEAALGEDWRDIIAALRKDTSAIWQTMTPAEQRQFLRHLRPYWDAHRHRVAPEPYAGFMQGVESGRLQLLAGRIQGFDETASGVGVRYRPRGKDDVQSVEVARVINCSGPATSLAESHSPLLQQLQSSGLIQSDPHRLGIATDSRFATINRDGQANPRLHYIGPGLRARFWEGTAVPELRQFAQQLAGILLSS
jgi:uncharacterized NAD(P)/FAD-binding protein YdhS